MSARLLGRYQRAEEYGVGKKINKKNSQRHFSKQNSPF